ncbi:aldehyde dehydrogenase, partial [Pisolithus microcarpus]
IHEVSKGTVLIISPWNYPVILTVQPSCGSYCLQGAVRFSKPSKALPHFAELLIEPVHKHPDTSAYRVISGAIPDTTKILELLNQWSHLFYTGNGKVPRIVTSAAAERLTPCSLELGWKSPVVVDAAV